MWGKRSEKLKKEGRTEREDGISAEERRLLKMREIEMARKRREDKLKADEEMERLRTEEQRLRESLVYGDWQKKEEEFHMEQIQVRSTIRLLENREKPIDKLASGILLLEAFSSNTLEDKATAFQLSKVLSKSYSNSSTSSSASSSLMTPLDILQQTLTSAEFDLLLDEIENYIELATAKSSPYLPFWLLLKETALCEKNLQLSQQLHSAIHKSAVAEVHQLLLNKSIDEVVLLIFAFSTMKKM